MSTTRAKFRCQTVTPQEWADRDGVVHKHSETWELFPVYSPDAGEENHRFWKASPSGSLRLQVDNPAAWGTVQQGQEYYLDITPAPATVPA